MKEKKARVEDALNATRAAVEEGIVPGGGVALVRCLKALETTDATGEEKRGIAILKRALTEPLKQIVRNAGHEGSVVLNKVLDGKGDYGFNAQSLTYENLLDAGVIDPPLDVAPDAGAQTRLLAKFGRASRSRPFAP